ncbi:hypothetical protein [Rhodoferax sp. TS-BS-61-7]|uniref:phage tail terminator protein n=1 Tax=Rhodoferax sp. TS-BS-61-7 TaxID=2094194 RepID=UPI000CF6B16E|nr:hypothetical protein [Rhodoferax sp. TS-BS-61-7]PQA78688.1 hypothetical protein C5F53_01545 [Rhodoferax sp. TS-BS-61-7]
MELEPIIEALRTRLPVFGNRVGGAVQFKALGEKSTLQSPCAYVIPLDDNASERKAGNTARQEITDGFAVVVVMSNKPDEKGQGSALNAHNMRTLLWAALLGWCPSEEYDPIVYEGGQLMKLDRAEMWFQYEFSAMTEITDADGWRNTELNGLPHFDGLDVQLDAIEPFDPNRGATGPDGRNETGGAWPRTGSLE